MAYLVPVFLDGASWAMGRQIAFSAADLAAKAGFGILIHKILKLRTAHEVATAEETHLEQTWVNNEKPSDARPLAVVDLTNARERTGGDRPGSSSARR